MAAIVIAFPVRRLVHDGRSLTTIVLYVVILVALAVGASELALARYLLPALGVVYILPFITWRAGLDRLLGRRPPIRVSRVDRPAIEGTRNVTPTNADGARNVTPTDADDARNVTPTDDDASTGDPLEVEAPGGQPETRSETAE